MSASTLPILLRSLGLTTLARDYPEAITRAEADNWGYLRFLHQLTEGELNERLRRRIERMLKESALPPGQNLAVIDQDKLPDKARRQLPSLLAGDFVRRGDNLLTFGLPGRGKTLFCAALGRELIQRHQLKVLFLPTYKLVNLLLIAKRDLKLPGFPDTLCRVTVVVTAGNQLSLTGQDARRPGTRRRVGGTDTLARLQGPAGVRPCVIAAVRINVSTNHET